jgi:hypothetical protein
VEVAEEGRTTNPSQKVLVLATLLATVMEG